MRNRWYALLCLLLLLLCPHMAIAAAQTITIGNATSAVGGGNTAVNIVLANNGVAPNVFAFDLEIAFDPTKFSADPVAVAGAALTAASKGISANVTSVTPTKSVISIVGFGLTTSVVGDGVLVTITFPVKATAAGATPITFDITPPDVTDPDNAAITLATVNGSITAPDTAAPVIDLSTLVDNSKTNVTPLNVSGTVTDNVGVATFKINTVSVTPSANGTFSAAVPLVAGSNTITAVATDAAGNSTTVTRTVLFDNVPPTLTITSPAADNTLTNVPTLVLSGTVNESSAIGLNLNGVDLTGITVTGTTFTKSVTLANGVNTINYTATDLFGNTSQSLKRTITLDTTAPAVAITAPAADVRSSVKNITVQGTVTDASNVTVVMTVDTQTFHPVVTAGAFSQDVTLTVDKTYVISVVATDGAGNVSQAATRNYILDTTIPAFALTTTNLVTAADSFTISGTKELGAVVTATCPTATATVNVLSPDTTWSVTLTGLGAGNNVVSLVATSLANNTSNLSTTVIKDNTAPTVDIFTIPGLVNNFAIPVTAMTASDANGIAGYMVTETNTPPAAGADGWTPARTVNYTVQNDGVKTLFAWAKDNAGNVSTALVSATVTVDTTAPVATIDSTQAALVAVNSASFSFSSVDTSASFLCKLDAGVFAACTSPKDYTALTDGSHTFTVQAKDPAGNVSSNVSRTWTVDTTAPTLTVSTLLDGGATNASPLNITGNVSDTNGVASLTVNGALVTVLQTGAYSYPLVLTVEGPVTITIVATDNAGNTKTDTRSITYDTTLPVVTITTPADNSQTKDAALTVTGTLSENSTVVIKNGAVTQAGSVTGTDYTGIIPLTSGLNTIEVTATDPAGNVSANVHRSVLYDPNSPALAITVPSHDVQVHTQPLTITGTVTDQTALTVVLTFEGVDYPQTVVDGTFTQDLTVPAVEGVHPVVVTATDAVGNAATVVTRNIIYVLTPASTTGDGLTHLIDVMKAAQFVFLAQPLTPVDKVRLDCAPLGSDGQPSPNGTVDSSDVILLLRRAAGLVDWH